MNEELNLEKLADLAVHYPEYLMMRRQNTLTVMNVSWRLSQLWSVALTNCICRVPHCSFFGCFPECLRWKLNFRML